MDRRRFLEIPVLGLPLLAASRVFGNSRPQNEKGAVVVSTWDSGRTANAAAWPILAKGGASLDAVEAGGRASEDEPSCCVGLQAWPDRDGKVTLDSSIMNGNGDCGGGTSCSVNAHRCCGSTGYSCGGNGALACSTLGCLLGVCP